MEVPFETVLLVYETYFSRPKLKYQQEAWEKYLQSVGWNEKKFIDELSRFIDLQWTDINLN